MSQIKTNTLNKFLANHQINKNISKYDMCNILSVVEKGEKSYFNLCKTLTIKDIQRIPSKYYKLYKCTKGDTWTNISYRYYNTIKLWWLICKFNNIKNPFSDLIEGKVIKIPTNELVNQIILQITYDR